jgi:hypothetical protein
VGQGLRDGWRSPKFGCRRIPHSPGPMRPEIPTQGHTARGEPRARVASPRRAKELGTLSGVRAFGTNVNYRIEGEGEEPMVLVETISAESRARCRRRACFLLWE